MKLIRTLAVCVTTLALILVGAPNESPAPAQASVLTTRVIWQTDGTGFESQEIEQPATMIGLTWTERRPMTAWYRVRQDGHWTPWVSLQVEGDHGPDPDTLEGRRSIPGSDAVWVGESEAVQFRTTGSGSRQAEAVLINTSRPGKPVLRRLTDFLTPRVPAASGAPSQPQIHPRSEWDPSNNCRPKAEPDFIQVTHAFVHHTSTSEWANNYSIDDVPERILGICLFHTQSRGWDDIGYNFLIDKYGQIWEGRVGGVENGVRGAHTSGFNGYSLGVAFIGYHTNTGPSPAAEKALEDLLSWKASLHNIDMSANTTLISRGSEKWAKGTPVSMKAISGHRDAQSTSCPGEACYRRLPIYRDAVNERWSHIPISTYVSPLIADFDGDGSEEAAIFRTTDGHWIVTEPNGSTSTWADFSTASGWSSQVVGDFNGDGRDDIANFHPSNGTWWISQSTGSGFTTRLWADFSTASGWSSQVVGDYNGDGRDDIANRHVGNGTWWVVTSSGGSFAPVTYWGTTTTLDHLSHYWVQDIDDDGRDDVLTVDAYHGFIDRHISSGSGFDIDWIVDTPWRTTVGGQGHDRIDGTTSWLYFGQEFLWARLTDLEVSIPDQIPEGQDRPAATATIVVTLPRP